MLETGGKMSWRAVWFEINPTRPKTYVKSCGIEIAKRNGKAKTDEGEGVKGPSVAGGGLVEMEVRLSGSPGSAQRH